jgi:tetratricopeptide (TPR) repeat protein
MGKTRPPERSKLDKRKKKLLADQKRKNRPTHTPAELLAQASLLLQQSEREQALEIATVALRQLKDSIVSDEDVITCLPALSLLGEINVELGEIDSAREYFSQAAQIDQDGDIDEDKGGGSEKFLWLAQLSEDGGSDSVHWYRKAADVLRNQIQSMTDDGDKQLIEEKKRKLSNTLCAVVEVYMTDLSWEEDAEAICDKLTSEALRIAPNNVETLQTIASVRISQSKLEEARQYLSKSLKLWEHLPVDSPDVPDFPVRISLVRLLMESDMEDEAMEVIERLIKEDDSSVETWYLGGWCLHLLGEKQIKATNGHGDKDSNDRLEILKRSRRWLLKCLKLYKVQDYEDDRLQEHATELVNSLNKVLGPLDEAEDEAEVGGEDGAWESADSDEEEESDEDMED